MKDSLHYLQLASSHFLTTHLPNDWHDRTVGEQNDFLSEYAWEPFQYTEPTELLSYIIDLSAELKGVAWAEREATFQEVKAAILKPFTETKGA